MTLASQTHLPFGMGFDFQSGVCLPAGFNTNGKRLDLLPGFCHLAIELSRQSSLALFTCFNMENTMKRDINKVLCFAIVASAAFFVPDSMHGQDRDDHGLISTFSIVGCDSATGELGVAVASRFFAVGSVVPWAKADVGAVATQSFANTTFGWRGLELLEKGASPIEIVSILLRNDADPTRRQFGIVAADGRSSTYTGKDCIPWAGGRSGPNYAAQGNILAGEAVVVSMESTFVHTNGTLAERLYAALIAGDRLGGDSRGKQSAALLVVKKNAGYNGYTDRAIDIRVDDHSEPFKELGRLLDYAQMNYAWNEAWTLFTHKKAAEALPHMDRAARLAPKNPEVLYDLAVIRLAAGKEADALDALDQALSLNPKLKSQARGDADMKKLKGNGRFEVLIRE
jgi:uncharacterized Ntn-hydrolase superfamily protein